MKLEVGKLYQTRDGRKCFISMIDDESHYYKYIGMIEGYSHTVRFREDGKFRKYEVSSCDLISEWPSAPTKNPVIYDRSLLPAWANKAIAMDGRGRWYCFATPPELSEEGWDATQGHCALIPREHSPQWSGDWKDSLLVFEDHE